MGIESLLALHQECAELHVQGRDAGLERLANFWEVCYRWKDADCVGALSSKSDELGVRGCGCDCICRVHRGGW